MESRGAGKPVEVIRAVGLLWAALAIGPVKVLLDIQHLRALGSVMFVGVVIVVVLAVSAVLIQLIARGRNWARLTYLVLMIFGSLPSFAMLGAEFGRSVVLGSLSVAQIALQVVALWLLFTSPGKAWFTSSQA